MEWTFFRCCRFFVCVRKRGNLRVAVVTGFISGFWFAIVNRGLLHLAALLFAWLREVISALPLLPES